MVDIDRLLLHNPHYGVLICTKCQYAVQKSALSSHLLRHKIYRRDRQHLLSSIANLPLLEPSDVPSPTRPIEPIYGLALIDGYRCGDPGCKHLCASGKRMQQHWREHHGSSEALQNIVSYARPARLQTFFRGTKLRYFEIATSDNDSTIALTNCTAKSLQHGDENFQVAISLDDSNAVEMLHNEDALSLPQVGQQHDTSLVNVDLTLLKYYHHFTEMLTSGQLLSDEKTNSAAAYWRGILGLALQHRWLMSGILAQAAFNLAVQTVGSNEHMRHLQCMTSLSSHFFPQMALLYASGNTHLDSTNTSIYAVGRQIARTLQYSQYAFSKDFVNVDELQSFLQSTMLDNQYMRPRSVHASIENPSTAATGQIKTPDCNSSVIQAEAHGSMKPPPDYTAALQALPAKMFNVLGRPNLKTFLAVLEAISALKQCCNVSFASEEASIAWAAARRWWKDIPEDFLTLLMRKDTATLIVLYYWAHLLLRRAEERGCWWLTGFSNKALIQIDNQIRQFVPRNVYRDD